MARIVAGIICLLAFSFGLVRLGVGLLLTAQVAGLIDFAAFSEPVADIQRFMAEKNVQAIIPLSPISYLAIIVFMGVSLTLGSVGAWRKQSWGYGLLALYLLTHSGLFVNFQTINYKIYILLAGIVLFVVLLIANRYRHT